MKAWLLALIGACLLLAAGASRAATPPAPHQVLVMLQVAAPHYRADANYGGQYQSDQGRRARRQIAEELASTHGLSLADNWPMPLLGVDCFVMDVPAGVELQAIAERLAQDRRVAWAQPVSQFHALGSGDPLYPVQPAASAWQLASLHKASQGRGVRVAVIDSGVDASHPELAGQLALQADFVDGRGAAAENHGTAVAGIIAAVADNGVGIRGVAPAAQLYALRACQESDGGAAQCSSFSLAKALHFAIMRDAQIINLSLSGPPDLLLARLLDTAQQRGIRVVGAADPAAHDGGFPANVAGVFAAREQAAPDHIAAGPGQWRMSWRAPGRDVPAPLPGGRFGVVSGASYSTAHLSGLLALLLEAAPQAGPAQLRQWLAASGASVPAAAGAMIDACAALGQAAARCVCSCATARTVQLK